MPQVLPRGAAVGHQRRKETLHPRRVESGRGADVVEGHDRVGVDQGVHVGGEQHRQVRRRAALVAGERLRERFLVGAGIDRPDADLGMLAREVLDQSADQRRERAAHRHREVEADLDAGRRERERRHARRQRGHRGERSSAGSRDGVGHGGGSCAEGGSGPMLASPALRPARFLHDSAHHAGPLRPELTASTFRGPRPPPPPAHPRSAR